MERMVSMTVGREMKESHACHKRGRQSDKRNFRTPHHLLEPSLMFCCQSIAPIIISIVTSKSKLLFKLFINFIYFTKQKVGRMRHLVTRQFRPLVAVARPTRPLPFTRPSVAVFSSKPDKSWGEIAGKLSDRPCEACVCSHFLFLDGPRSFAHPSFPHMISSPPRGSSRPSQKCRQQGDGHGQVARFPISSGYEEGGRDVLLGERPIARPLQAARVVVAVGARRHDWRGPGEDGRRAVEYGGGGAEGGGQVRRGLRLDRIGLG